MCGCLSRAPYWGSGLHPRHVPWLGIEPVTLWFTGWHSIHWATPARAPFYSTLERMAYCFFVLSLMTSVIVLAAFRIQATAITAAGFSGRGMITALWHGTTFHWRCYNQIVVSRAKCIGFWLKGGTWSNLSFWKLTLAALWRIIEKMMHHVRTRKEWTGWWQWRQREGLEVRIWSVLLTICKSEELSHSF